MRNLSMAGIAAVALLASGFVSDASAQGNGRGQNAYRARGIARARQVANENARFLRDDCDCDRDSDRKWKKAKHKKHGGNCGNDGVISQRSSRLPSGVCVDSNGDGICDGGTVDNRRPRTRTGNGGVILGRRAPGDAGVILGKRGSGTQLVQQVGLQLLQRAAYAQRFR